MESNRNLAADLYIANKHPVIFRKTKSHTKPSIYNFNGNTNLIKHRC